MISGNVTDIESSAFYGSGLISVTIPGSVTRIATQAFRDCKSLELLVMEATPSTYGTQMFFNCIKLDNVVLPEGWKSISTQMFTLCSSLTNITIPESVTKIDNYAFERCKQLVGIEIPSNVTIIGNGAFEECVKLENIVIPSKVASIGSKAFADCKKLERISFLSDEAPGITNDIFKSSPRVTIYHKKEATGFDQGIWGSLSVTKVPVPALNIIDELEAKSENSNSILLSWTFSDTADEVYSSGIPLTHQIFYKITDSEEWIEYTGTIYIDMNISSILLDDVYDIGPTEFKMVISEEYLGQSVEYGPVITQYLMTWNIDGIEDAKYLDNGAVLEIPKNAGYKLSNMPVCLNMPTEDLSITASWVQIVYTIVFENEDGTYFQDSISDKYYGDVVVIPALSDKAGYKPGVWVIKGTAIEITDFNDLWGYAGQTIEDTITLTAIYEPIEYTIEFVTEDGIAPDSIEVYFKDPESGELPGVNQKTGYNGKWIISGTDIEIENFDDIWDNIGQAVGTTVTLYAIWEINEYTITLVYGNGQDDKVITQDYDTEIAAEPNPEKTGYTFVNWDDEIPTRMPAYGMTITAIWKINEYTITFDTQDGTGVDDITEEYNTNVTLPGLDSTAKTGYTFRGWVLPTGGNPMTTHLLVDNVTLFAIWEINEYTITLVYGNGQDDKVITQDYDTEIAAEPNPEKTGYTFVNWDDEIPTRMPAYGMTITAIWKINEYTITFDTQDGTGVDDITEEYNTNVTLPGLDSTAKTGYTFRGWVLPTGGNPMTTHLLVDNVTLFAIWEINEYTITLDTKGGSDVPEIIQGYDTPIITPANPTKTGYIFIGWTPTIPDTMPLDGLNVSAVWEPRVYEEVPSADDISDIIGSNDEPIIKINSGTEDFVIDNVIFDNIGNKILVIDVVDDEGRTLYSWTFSGDYVDNAGSFKTKISEVEGVEEVDNLIESSRISDSLVLEFSASGILPMGALVKYYVGDKYESGRVLSLFFFNEETNRLEDEGQELTVDDDGYVTFTLTHCSVYVIGELSESDGDSMILYVGLAVAAIVAIVAALFVIRRRA